MGEHSDLDGFEECAVEIADARDIDGLSFILVKQVWSEQRA